MGDFNNPNENNGNQQPYNPNTDQSQPQYQQPTYQQPQYQQPQYGGQSQYNQPNTNQGQYQQPYTQYQQPIEKKNNAMSIASMVCGIVSLVSSCCVYLSVPLAVVGLILGILSIKNKNDGKGMAIAGIILSGITLFLVLIIIIACVAFPDAWNELLNDYNWDSYYNY